MRRVLTALTASAVLLATGSTLAPPADAVDPAALVGFEYLNGPYAWAGQSDLPVAEVVLDQPAEADTAVALQSSDPSVVVPPSVTVPAGSTTADVLVHTVAAGTATLSATLGVTTISATPPLEVRTPGTATALSDLTVAPTTVAPTETATATVSLDFLAPPGGTTVAIASSDTELGLPTEVTVLSDQHEATFAVPVPIGYNSGEIVLTATLGEVSRQATLTVVDPDPDGDGVIGDADRCPDDGGSSTADGCPKIGAVVELAYRRATERFRGSVTAVRECDVDRKVTVYRVRSGPDGFVGSSTTDDEGRFVVKKEARAGRYYAKAAAMDVPTARCVASASDTIRVGS